MDEFDLDDMDDLGLDDELGGLGMDGFDTGEEPPAANKREAVERGVKKAAGAFKEEFDIDNSLETASTIAKASVPKDLSRETDIASNILTSTRDEVKKAGSELRKEARGTFAVFKRLLPENDRVNKIVNKVDGWLGTDSPTSSGPSKEDLQKETIKNNIIEALGEKEESSVREQLLKDIIDKNRHLDNIQLLGTIAGNMEISRKFDTEITNSYYRRSLELKYKSLFLQKESFELQKANADSVRVQLESIIKNTSLPEIVKMRNTEAIKENLMRRTADEVNNKLFGADTWYGKTKERLLGRIGEYKDSLLTGLTTSKEMLEQREMMQESTAQAGGGAVMFGSMVGDAAKNFIGKKIGDKISKTEKGKEGINNVKNIMMDPSAHLDRLAEKTENGVAKSLLSTLSSLTNNRIEENKREINSEINLASERAEQNKYNSITNIIPNLLSKIYGSVEGIRTGQEPEELEVHYDKDKGEFVNKKTAKKNIEENLRKTLTKSISYSLDSFIKTLSDKGGLEIENDVIGGRIRKGILSYVMSGKSLAPKELLRNNLDEHFDGKEGKDVTKALAKTLKASKEDPYILNKLNNDLTSTRDAIPSVDSLVNKYEDLGRTKDLEDMGLAKRDELTNELKFDNDNYKKMVIKQTGLLDNDLVNKQSEKIEEAQRELEESKSFLNNLKDKVKSTELDPKDILRKAKGRTTDNITVDGVKEKFSSVKDYITGDYKDESKEEIKEEDKSFFTKAKETGQTFAKAGKNTFRFMKFGAETVNKVADGVDGTKEFYSDVKAKIEPSEKTKKKFKEQRQSFFKKASGVKQSIETDINNYMETKDISSRLKDINPLKEWKMNKESEEKLMEIFLRSKAYKDGYIKNFTEFKRAMGYVGEDTKILDGDDSKETKTENFLDLNSRLEESLEEITAEEEEKLRIQFFNSKEFKSGILTNFTEYKKALGVKVEKGKGTVKSILESTKDLDKKIFKALIKSPVTLAKLGFKGIGKVTSSIKTLVKGKKSKLDEMKEARAKEDSFFKRMKDVLHPKKEKAFNDKDGDGIRDGGWRDKLSKKKDNVKNTVKNVFKKPSNKEDKPTSLLMGILGALGSIGGIAGKMLGGIIKLPMLLGGAIASLLGKLPGMGKLFGKKGNVAKDTVKNTAKKTAKKSALKAGAKAVGKSFLKKIPVIGALAGLGFGISRLMDGDTVGAGAEVASGLMGSIPFIGTAASAGTDAWLANRDMNKTEEDTSVKKSLETGKQDTITPKSKDIEITQDKLDKIDPPKEIKTHINPLEKTKSNFNKKLANDQKQQNVDMTTLLKESERIQSRTNEHLGSMNHTLLESLKVQRGILSGINLVAENISNISLDTKEKKEPIKKERPIIKEHTLPPAVDLSR